jgi:hypothetical protein
MEGKESDMKQSRTKYEKPKAAYEKASKDYTELLRAVEAAERDLRSVKAAMEKCKEEGDQQAFEELDNYFQQNYPDYTKMLRRLSVAESELEEKASAVKPWEDYFRDTGFYPGLG